MLIATNRSPESLRYGRGTGCDDCNNSSFALYPIDWVLWPTQYFCLYCKDRHEGMMAYARRQIEESTARYRETEKRRAEIWAESERMLAAEQEANHA